MAERNRLLAERAVDGEVVRRSEVERKARRPARSVTVNLVESPLGWLHARGHIDQRQYDAGERLRADWERGQLSPRITMSWDAAPVQRGRGGSVPEMGLSNAQLDARRRFHAAIEAAGPGLADVLWRVACAGEGMREAETALGWPARAGKVVLTIALGRIADYYRIK